MANTYDGVSGNEFQLNRLRIEEEEILYRIQTVRDRMNDCDRRINEHQDSRRERARREPYGWIISSALVTVLGLLALAGCRFVGAGVCLIVAAILWIRTVSEHCHVCKSVAMEDNAINRSAQARKEANDELIKLRAELSAVRERIKRLDSSKN